MPKRRPAKGKREIERLFQLGDYWIGQEIKGGSYYRYWYDEKRRRTRRKSFGRNVAFEQAKKELAKLYLEEPKEQQQAPDGVSFTRVKKFYLKHKGNKARARDGIEHALKLMTDYLKFSLKRAPMVSDMTLARQKGFMMWCRDKQDLSAKTISIYLSYVKAAVNFCATPQLIIDGKGDEREILILKNAPKILIPKGSSQKKQDFHVRGPAIGYQPISSSPIGLTAFRTMTITLTYSATSLWPLTPGRGPKRSRT